MDIQKLEENLLQISNRVSLPDHIMQILPGLASGVLNRSEVEQTAREKGIYYMIAKVDYLHFIFEYIRLSLEDNVLTTEEKEVITYFKKVFDIQPGDFKQHCNPQIRSVLETQFARIYDDNCITAAESLLKDDLQQLFDLSFDEINHYSQSEAITSLKLGADLKNLDVQFTHKEYFELKKLL